MKKSLWIVLLLALICTLALSACDDTNQPQTPNEDHVHAFGEWTTVKDATCTVKGEQERICSCGEKETKSIDATGHTEVVDAAVAPACNATGLTEGKHCSVCNETIVAQEVVAKLEHTPATDAAVEATCSATGLTEGSHCSVCNAVITAQQVVAKKAHTTSDWITDTEATCSVAGAKHKECTVCHTVLESGSIDKVAHTPATDAAVEATCSATGLTEGSHCSVCNAVITAQQVVAKKAHTTSDWLTDTEATCSVAGAKHKECTVCHTVLESSSIDKIAHTPATDAAVEATCSATGLTEGSHCSVCNAVITAQQVVAKKDHTIVVDAAVDATCNSTGLTEGNHCSVCNATLVAQRVTSKLTHVLSVKITDIPETCTDDGTYYIECTLCHIILERGTLEGGHNYKSTIIAPTASAQGYTQHVCARCNDTYTDTIVPALGFTGLAYVINEDGRTCTITGLGSVTETEIAIPLEIDGYKVTAIGDKAFENCTHLTKILLQDSITTIGTRAFYGCTGLTEFTIPKNVRYYGSQIFYKADNLKTIYHYSTYSSDASPFASSSIETVVLMGVTSVPNVFAGSAVKSIVISNTVTGIGSQLAGMTSLRDITIGKGITYIDDEAFTGCINLKNVYYLGDVADWCNISFNYKSYGGDSSYSTEGNPMYFAEHFYINGEEVTEIIIPEGVTHLNRFAFYGFANITKITLPSTITSIGCYAFSGCDNLKEVYYGGSIESWCSISFGNDLSYNSGNPSSNPMSRAEHFFINGIELIELVIPDTVSKINERAFYGFNNITSVVFSDSVSTISTYAFYQCNNLRFVVLPSSISAIGESAFSNCTNLSYVLYEGTEDEWSLINIADGNNYLKNAVRHYNYDGSEYTYSFDVNGGDPIESVKSIVAIELPTPTKEGYYFGGWYDNAEFNGTPLASPYYSSSSHTLYAKWLTEEEWLVGTTFERAIVIVCDEMQNVVIDTAGERVYFKFVATETRAYTISSQGGLDTYGHLYNSSTSQIASNDGGNDFSITYTLTAGETYYIAARMYSSSATGTFTITIS